MFGIFLSCPVCCCWKCAHAQMRAQLHVQPENKTWVHFQRGRTGKWGSGIMEWEKVRRGRKREFYGTGPAWRVTQASSMWFGSSWKLNPCKSLSANRSTQSHEDKIISTSGNMVAVYQMKNQLTWLHKAIWVNFSEFWGISYAITVTEVPICCPLVWTPFAQ